MDGVGRSDNKHLTFKLFTTTIIISIIIIIISIMIYVMKVVYTVGERVFAMDLQSWTTEDLGPVIIISDQNDDYNEDNFRWSK